MLICSGIFLAASCQPNEVHCFETYIPEVPITASFQDTMSVGDTIEITVHFRDSLLDIISNEMMFLGSTPIDNRIQFTIPRLDTNIIDTDAERFFLMEEVIGSIVEQPLSTFSHYYMKFERRENNRIFKFRLYPQRAGIFSVAFFMTTDLMQELELPDVTDCFERVENIYYNTNDQSEQNNYYLQETSELYLSYESTLADFDKTGSFAFVVE